MGFTECVTRLTDFDRDRRTIRLALEASSVPYRPFEARGVPATTREIGHGVGLRPVRKRPEFEAGHSRHVPEAWPTLLSREQLCAYVGVSAATITRICPVRPLDMGASLVRYSRAQIDEWVATLPPRLMVAHGASEAATVGPTGSLPEEVAESRPESALDRVRARAGGSKWRKTA